MWEVYTLDEDIEHRGDGQLPVVDPAPAHAPASAIWNHQLGQPFPAKLPILDGTVDLVRLQGTLNERLPSEEVKRRLREVLRILKPGGRVQMHMLTADRELGDEPLRLPGPAAAVQCVPVDNAVLQLLAEVGFFEPRYAFRATSPCFRIGNAELRETRIEATRQ
jgi:SAM-dependent methyltransferase